MTNLLKRLFFCPALVSAKAFLALILLAAGPVAAHEIKAGDLTIDHPFAYASIGMAKAGAAFMTIRNAGAADRLIAAESDVSVRTELHNHIHEGGKMMMRQVPGIDVPAHGEASLAPGGYHVMFMGLKQKFVKGQMVPVTLVFEKAGRVQVEIMVIERQ